MYEKVFKKKGKKIDNSTCQPFFFGSHNHYFPPTTTRTMTSWRIVICLPMKSKKKKKKRNKNPQLGLFSPLFPSHSRALTCRSLFPFTRSPAGRKIHT